MIEWRPILLVNGIFLSILAVFMLIPALVDAYVYNPDWESFLKAFAITFFIGISLYLTNRGYRKALNIKQAFMLTASGWMILPVFAALPFYLSGLNLSYVDSFFEAVSGLTTTGSTIMVGLDTMPPGILLWRSILQWLGGIGIIVLAVAILPLLRIGGMQLFRTESSDKSDKILPRARQMASVIGMIYLGFTFTCAVLLWWAGMDRFDAVNHAMTTISTGGLSTHDRSIGHYDNVYIEIILTFFMALSSLPFLLYFLVIGGRADAFWNDSQVRTFITLVAIVVAIITAWLFLTGKYDSLATAFRYALFNVVSLATTTGYGSTDYNAWGTFGVTALFLFCVLGGCTGSTTGGIKMFRFQVLLQIAKVQIAHLIRPHQVIIPLFNGKPIELAVTNAVMSYCLLFAVCFMFLAMALSLFGLDYITCMSGAAAVLANIGPGFGDVIGPTGSFQPLPDGAKLVLAFGMILGRLELFTILVLFTPAFWKD